MRNEDDLDLVTRSGLPESVAYLRQKFPSSQWRHHPNYGALADFWLQIHKTLRSEGAALRTLTENFDEDRTTPEEFRRAFPPLLSRHLQHLAGHHHVEDQMYFPRFKLLDRRMKVGFDLLELDHQQIHHQLEQSAASANKLLGSLQLDRDARRAATEDYAHQAQQLLELLDRHLGDEEDLVVPAMLEHGERAID